MTQLLVAFAALGFVWLGFVGVILVGLVLSFGLFGFVVVCSSVFGFCLVIWFWF